MFNVGICDDSKEDIQRLKAVIEPIFAEIGQECKMYEYSSGEIFYDELSQNSELQIDLLFLDIEMSGVDGISLRDKLIKNRQVWRIIFVSNHDESVMDAFGLKTVGFVSKPADRKILAAKIGNVIREYNADRIVELPSARNGNRFFMTEKIAYFLAEGNYSTVYTTDEEGRINESELICCKLIDIERKLDGDGFTRIHKSYYVNMNNVTGVSGNVTFRDSSVILPIGRKYREIVKEKYYDFILTKAREQNNI